ncbi:MAG TPA: LacI family DNA-binding transcriptional regulator [Rectinemataceae bacterium]|nr:LacI family DNA-binding transcriptional regulator [Rectinemataceae bacterium]
MKSAKRKATIRDVAERAGVSISTVSHVVNKTRHVEEPTRDRILSAIGDLDYRPNQFARGLRGGKTATLGLIISDIREEFFSAITKTIESAANERGYTVILCDSEEDVEKERLYLEILTGRGVDGIILAPVDSELPPQLPRGRKAPMVQIDRRCPAAQLDFAGIDNRKHAAAAVRHLVDSGRGQIGCIVHEAAIWTMSERAEGFRAAMRDLGHEEGGRVLTLWSRGDNPKAVVRRWIAANLDLEAILCGNANICFTVLEVLEDMGIAGPRDLSLVAFDDLECFRFLRRPVTTIRQPTEKMALAALDMLIERMTGGGPQTPRETILPARLVVREAARPADIPAGSRERR